jgi:hypothetical protein
MSCKFANILGIPGKGVHTIHVGNVALVDLVLTVGIGVGLSYIPKSPPLTIWIILLLLFSIMIHSVFCTKTSVLKWLYEGELRLPIVISIMVAMIVVIIMLKKRVLASVYDA